jgi:hypothetical protein
MHVEVVKVGAIPSRGHLMHDSRCELSCGECQASYYLYYDSEAEFSFTHWSMLAEEIITARHPDHRDRILLNQLKMF